MHSNVLDRSSRPALRNFPIKSCILSLLSLVLVASPLAQAQFSASLRGTVTDPTGAIVPGASVSLVDKETNQTRTSVTDQAGLFNFAGLAPNRYSLSVERDGFKKKSIDQVVLIPEQANVLNVQIEVGAAQETVTVNGSAAPLLDTGTATVSQTVSSEEIQHLPSFNRDVFQLAQLAPGAFGDASQSAGGGSYELPGNQGPGGSGSGTSGIFQTENGPQIQARGGQYETNGISVDGISTVSAVWGGTSVITPSEDSVQDVKIVSNSYDAEVGRFSGGQIQVTSKSGTNDVHGSAFFKASRPGLNAYQRWNGLGSTNAGTPESRGLNRDENRFNNYGGSLGGPFWRNHVFGFFNYETSPLSAVATAQSWYETPQFDSSAASSGTIASKYLSYKGEGVAAAGMVPTTCAQIGLSEGVNCATTPNGLDVGSPLKFAPGTQDPTYGGSTTNPGVGAGLDGVPDLALFSTVDPTTTSQQQYNGRLDAQIRDRDHLAFAIYWVPVSSTDYNGPVRSANFWHHSQTNDAFSLIWNHTFSPTLLNQARANAAGWRWNEVTSNPQEPFGLPQDNVDNMGSLAGNGNFQFFGPPGPSNYNQWTYDYNDVLTKILGRHSIKTGGDFTRLYFLNNPTYSARPQFSFRNLWDFANDAPYQESGQFNAATGVPFANRQDDRINMLGLFIQDDFKLRPNFTINAGLRWSWFGPFYSKENNLDVLRFGSGSAALSDLNVKVGGNLDTPQKWNFGPQLGFAWLPKSSMDRLVIRGGFGINYNQNEIAIISNGVGNPPNAVQASFCCSTPAVNAPGIFYETASNINSLFGFAPNPATITTFGPNNLPASATSSPISVTGFDANPKTIMNYHYSLDMQYQFPFETIATVGYQGSESRHLLIQNNFNAVAAARGIPLNPAVNFVDYYANAGTANYNALIATLKHTLSHNFNLEAQYTWAKSMDENSGPYEEDPYPYDSHAAYGRSDYNVADAVKIFGLWQPVFFHGGHEVAEKLAGGWSLSGIFNWHTGFPINPLYNVNTAGGLYYNGSSYKQLRPASIVGGAGMRTGNSTFMQTVNPNYNGNPTAYFTSPTFVDGPTFPAIAPPPVPGIHRNSVNGPGYNDVDASLSKGFGFPANRVLGEHARLEFRADFYNLFNKNNLNPSNIDNILGSVNPDGTVSSINTDFGVARTALGSRTIQLQSRFSF